MMWQGKRALVTGASAGIGSAFAKELAAAGVHLVITARREDRLQALASELKSTYGIEVHVVTADLGSFDGAAVVENFLKAEKLEIDILVNNAGFGIAGSFVETAPEKVMGMIQVNITSLVELTYRLLPGMLERKSGHIMLVGSLNAFMSVPTFAVYSATKAFVRSFGEGLAGECAGSGVSVTTVHPGGTATEFSDVAEMNVSSLLEKGMMTPGQVAQIAVSASRRGAVSVVTGLMNKVVVFLLWLTPGCMVRAGAKFGYGLMK
ncbi:MAG: SDR family oxidoreductase [Myxococcota bacterium]|nr:SDR family oxidoreductase [Myxococcota bacterium]